MELIPLVWQFKSKHFWFDFVWLSSRNRGSGSIGVGVARPLQLLSDVWQQHQPGGGRIQEELPELGLQEPQGRSQHLLSTSR